MRALVFDSRNSLQRPAWLTRSASLVWEKTLEKKYAYQEHNCQVFGRLLIELIGNKEAKVEFPAALDRWLEGAGIAWDTGMTASYGVMTLLLIGACSIAVDPTGTICATFQSGARCAMKAAARRSKNRGTRGKKVMEGQNEIRKEMRERGRSLADIE